ncbi:MAG TPA: SDR family NAD(P)-dependent oxidoreductase [Kineosporiaceae bacterium]|nr:SDR family NAD(P)-dependent oxidoreductase [Kineosporiaceae bacterium]
MSATTAPSPPPARTALVTGAGRGLGRALAVGLARAGVRVAVLGRSRESLTGVLAELEAVAASGPGTAGTGSTGGTGPGAGTGSAGGTGPGGTPVAVVADVRDFDAVTVAAGEAGALLGGIDLLVNNAGVIEPVEVPVWEADPQGWWEVVETDLRGPFHCVRAVVPDMLARGGGRVVDLSSGAGATDREVYSAYCAAKAGLFRLAGNLHLAGYPHGLRAFELSPGVVRTDMTAGMAMHAGREDWTAVDRAVALLVAIAAGRLDAWSGCFLRSGVDDPDTLAARRPAGTARRLVVAPYGPDDPLG